MFRREKEPTQVLFHGTSMGRFEQLLQPDGSYQDPKGDPIWLDEQTTVPLTKARQYKQEHDSDAVLLMVRSDALALRRPSNAIPQTPDQLSVPNYWTTSRLPAGSFVRYNVTQDPDQLFNNTPSLDHHLDGVTRMCEPLGVVPEYVTTFKTMRRP